MTWRSTGKMHMHTYNPTPPGLLSKTLSMTRLLCRLPTMLAPRFGTNVPKLDKRREKREE